jgi:hypothetical protein
MSRSNNTVRLTGVRFIVETDNAILIGYGNEQEWIPFSQVEEIQRHPTDWSKNSIEMSEWIAEQKGLV